MTREGFIFVIVEGEEDDVFVKASKTRGALNGDTVVVAVTRDKNYILTYQDVRFFDRWGY